MKKVRLSKLFILKSYNMIFSLLGVAVFFAPPVFAVLKTQKPPAMWMCKLNNNVRTIRIERNTDLCETVYTKDGADTTVATAKYLNTCTSVLANIKQNLEGANWVCRDISDSRITETQNSSNQ